MGWSAGNSAHGRRGARESAPHFLSWGAASGDPETGRGRALSPSRELPRRPGTVRRPGVASGPGTPFVMGFASALCGPSQQHAPQRRCRWRPWTCPPSRCPENSLKPPFCGGDRPVRWPSGRSRRPFARCGPVSPAPPALVASAGLPASLTGQGLPADTPHSLGHVLCPLVRGGSSLGICAGVDTSCHTRVRRWVLRVPASDVAVPSGQHCPHRACVGVDRRPHVKARDTVRTGNAEAGRRARDVTEIKPAAGAVSLLSAALSSVVGKAACPALGEDRARWLSPILVLPGKRARPWQLSIADIRASCDGRWREPPRRAFGDVPSCFS